MTDERRPPALDAIADAELYPYWFDDADEPDSNPTLVRAESCDLCIVGGGYTGLWTAIIAKERDPSRDVVLIDAGEVGSAASGRNGGFMESSLTHGVGNGQERFPDEIQLLEQLGLENLDAIENAIHRYDIDCDFERTGVIDVATTATRRATSTSSATTPCSCGGSARTPAGSTPRRCAPRSAHPPTSAGCGGSAGPRSSTRPGWRGDSRRRPSGSACASTRTPRRRRSSATASACS